MRPLAKLSFTALLASALLLGCTSIDRLMRSTPASPTEGPPEERINVWPILYKSGGSIAVLWPIFDMDAKGFALRPVIAKDGSKWEVLPPLAWFDTGKGDWFVLPAYSLGDSHGFFPIYNRGWINNAGPVFWTEDEQGRIERGGLFPVALLGKHFNYVGPAWWILDEEGSIETGGLFPIAHFGKGFSYAGPAFWLRHADTGELESGGLFPVAWFGGSFNYAGLAFWNRARATGELESGGLFPVAYYSPDFNYTGPAYWNFDAAGQLYSGGLLPVAYFSPHFNYTGPVYWNKDGAGNLQGGGVFPFGYVSGDFSYFGPFFWNSYGTGELQSGGLFPVAWFSPEFNYVGPAFWNYGADGLHSGGLFPIARVKAGPGWSYALPGYWHRNESGEIDYGGCFPLFNLTPSFNYAGPVYWYYDDRGRATFSGVFPIANFTPFLNHVGPVYWTKNEKGEVVRSGVFPLAYFGPEFNIAGPAWWTRDPRTGELRSGGLFPIATFSPHINNIGPVLWLKDSNGEITHMTLPPLAYLSPELSFVGPAWWTDDSGGLFPLASFTPGINHIGPAYWIKSGAAVESYGLLPLAHIGPDLSYTGPAWWRRDPRTGELTGGGLFPVANFSEPFSNVGPVFWGNHPDGALDFFVAPPLASYDTKQDGAGLLITPLAASGWDAAGESLFVNVLGAVYHFNKTRDGSFRMVTPFYTRLDSESETRWEVWPLFGRKELRDEKGVPWRYSTSLLAGLIRHEGLEGDTDSFRALPFVTYRSEHGGERDLTDWFSLVSYKDYGEAGADVHVGTPLVFDYKRDGDHTKWNSLLWTLQYQSEGDTSEFNFLYYLYRQKTEGTETRRDLFPFITWDSGEKRSGFSFLWRLFNYERRGDKVGGHVLFVPWGDSRG